MSDHTSTYRFAPRQEGGALGLSRPQVVAVSAGILLALVSVLGARQPLVGLGFLVLAAVVAFAPIGGRPLVAWWAPLGARLCGRRGAIAPLGEHELHRGKGVRRASVPSAIRWHLPGVGRLTIRSVPTPVGEVAVADLSGGRRSASVTFALDGPRFGLIDAEEQSRALGSWGQLLGALARESRELQRLQLTERIVPDDLAPHFAYLAEFANGADPTALVTYRRELELLAGTAVRHEVLLTATLGKSGRSGHADVVASECVRLTNLLDSAGFLARPLDTVALASTIRSILDPEGAVVLGEGAPSHAPQAWRSSWGTCVTDSGHHASFEASGLPRLPVGPEWAWPLVLAEPPVTRRTLALHLELARPDLAIRRAERAVLSQEGDEAMRARWGFRSGARQDQAHDAALAREVELATGFADARFALVVTVSATNVRALDESCRALVSQAAQSHVELRRCYGRQAHALVASLPLGVVRFSGGWR